MTTLDALYRAVLDAPDDDTPRLVMADALDDAGEAEQAELIRVQCALARPVHRAERDRLVLRVWDLMREAREWLFAAWPEGGNFYRLDTNASFVCVVPAAEFVFARGFATLRTESAAFVRQAAALGCRLLHGVVLADKEPWGSKFSWYDPDLLEHPAAIDHQASDLPADLFAVLYELAGPANLRRQSSYGVWHGTRKEADAALSRAACVYAHRRFMETLTPPEEAACPSSPPSS